VGGDDGGNHLRELGAALDRRLDRVGVVGVIAEDQPEIDERQPARKRLAGDDVVEDGEPGIGDLARR
jgi:hypothetical protein